MGELLGRLAEYVGGEVIGDPDTCISGIADISDAIEGDLVFAESPKLLETAMRSSASAVIACNGADGAVKPMILVDDPRLAFAKALEVFSKELRGDPGIHPSSTVGECTSIAEDACIGANVHIGSNTTIGSNVYIFPSVFIGSNVQVGDNCVLHPFVSIYDGVTIGSNVIVHSGSIIGSDGFGYTKVGDKHYKIPQIGTVTIGDDVEIGANCTIDRARTGRTTIGTGTKIDNLVHIAHNVSIGENCIIIALTGISGSVEIGDRVILTGQAGIKDHISIGSDAIVAGRAGVFGNIEPGAFVSGYPARPHKEQMRVQAAQMRLPELLRQIKKMEQRIGQLEEQGE